VPSALIALAYYLILPFGVQASRSFQPDPLMTSSFVAGIYFLYRWGEDARWRWAMLGAAFAALAVLVKVVIVFLVAGAAIAVVLVKLGRKFWRSPQVWVMAAMMSLPSAFYYLVLTSARSSEYFLPERRTCRVRVMCTSGRLAWLPGSPVG
jgi:4-amino-4-deoxy-L-arabinose transferase-like glycosyltransferase